MAGLIAGAAALLLAAAAAQAEEVPATPLTRDFPPFPEACIPAGDAPAETQSVTVMFDVTATGETTNIRIAESTDACFNEAAIAAVRFWQYAPRRIGGAPAAQADVKTTIVFEPGDAPAAPRSRRPPDYPTACLPPPGTPVREHSVVVMYDVSRDGVARNVRAAESTDPCFEETAIAAVRSWGFTPKRVNGVRRAQEALETTFVFVIEEPTQLLDFDASPLVRMPPAFPERCLASADDSATILLEFDITAEGATENARIIESTNTCLEKAARDSVAKWRYKPKTIGGKAVPRKNVQTRIIFELSDGGSGVRRTVAFSLYRINREIQKKEPDIQKALADLDALEEKHGDSFSPEELRGFHQVRAGARIEAGDYRGALDDLRVVRRLGMSEDLAIAVNETIASLETAIAAQDAAAAKQSAESGTEERPPEEP